MLLVWYQRLIHAMLREKLEAHIVLLHGVQCSCGYLRKLLLTISRKFIMIRQTFIYHHELRSLIIFITIKHAINSITFHLTRPVSVS